MANIPTIQIVSKPLCPPWSDGTKNLARTIAVNAIDTRFFICGDEKYFSDYEHIRVINPVSEFHEYQPRLIQNMRMFFNILFSHEKPDVLHFFFTPNTAASAMMKWLMIFKKIKSIHTITSRPVNTDKLSALFFADLNVALSESTKQLLLEAGVSNVELIYPGIDVPRAPLPAGSLPWKNLNDDADFLLLYPGDYEFSQGHEIILSSAKQILNKFPKIKFIFACRNKTSHAKKIETAVKTQIKNNGLSHAFVFLNETLDFQELIKACDIVLFPVKSLEKKMDLPLVLLESMSFGKTVIVSRLQPLRELVADESGVVVNEDDAASLAEAVVSLLSDANMRLGYGANARERIARHFDAKKAAANYRSIYNRMCPSQVTQQKSQQYYNDFSKHYEDVRHEGYHALIDEQESSIVKKYFSGQSGLEVGCGTGLILERLKDTIPRLNGLDLTPGMIRKAHRKGHAVVLGTATSLPFDNELFDMTYCFKTFAHIENPALALKEMARVTKENGHVIVGIYNPFSLRGLRWIVRKYLSKKNKDRLTEADIYTQYQSLDVFRKYLPDDLKIINTHACIIWSPAAFVFKIPVLKDIFYFLETKLNGAPFKFLGGFTAVVLTKRSLPVKRKQIAEKFVPSIP